MENEEKKLGNQDEPDYEPEDCDECGCEAGEFEDSDWDNGHYKCPQCGAVC
jgi:hypothetical protein